MHQDNIGFALLREVGFSNSEAAAFSRYLRGSHLNLYRQKGAPPKENHVQPSAPWVVGCDFNEIPIQSHFARVASGFQGTASRYCGPY